MIFGEISEKVEKSLINHFLKSGQSREREVVFQSFLDFIKMCQNTPQLCWGDKWPPLSPGGRGLG